MRKEVQEGTTRSKNTYEMEILKFVALEKSIDIKRKTLDGKKKLNTISEVIYENYLKESKPKFPGKPEYNVPQFIPTENKKNIQDVRLEYGLFYHMIKIKITDFVNTTNIIKGNPKKRVLIIKGSTVVEFDNTKSPQFKFVGHTSRPNKWFVLNYDCLKKLTMTRQKDFYEGLHHPNVFVNKE